MQLLWETEVLNLNLVLLECFCKKIILNHICISNHQMRLNKKNFNLH